MRLTPALLACSLLLAGCRLPVDVVKEAVAAENVLTGKGSLGTSRGLPNPVDGRLVSGGNGVIAAGGGNVIAAGGGNVIAAGGGNVIAAGGGNVISADAAPASSASNVIAAGGGNLVVTSGAGVIAAGGMNLAGNTGSLDLPVTTVPDAPTIPGALPEAGPGGGGLTAGNLVGQVVVPGAMIGSQAASVPVTQTYVGVYDLTGQPIGTPVRTDAQGTFRLEGVPAYRMLSLRTVFTYNGHDYYLSTLVRVESTDQLADLSPVSTVTEAEYFLKANGTAPGDDFIGSPYLTTFLAGLSSNNGEVPASALAGDAPLATRAAGYAAVKAKHPQAFANDIDAAFDGTAVIDPTGLTAGEAGAGDIAAEL